MIRFYQPDLGSEPDSPFARDVTLPPTFIQWQLESERRLCPVGRWWWRSAERSRRWSAAQRTAVARRGWRGSASRAASAADADCTTRFENTHGTEIRELLYPWHPWFALWVAVHEAIDKADGVVFRCSLSGSDAGRWLEVPAWMFERSACAGARIATDAHADLAALIMLATLLRQCTERPFSIIECSAFGCIKTLSRPESGRGLCHAGRSRCRRAAARRNKSTCSQENRGQRSVACRHGRGCRRRPKQR